MQIFCWRKRNQRRRLLKEKDKEMRGRIQTACAELKFNCRRFSNYTNLFSDETTAKAEVFFICLNYLNLVAFIYLLDILCVEFHPATIEVHLFYSNGSSFS